MPTQYLNTSNSYSNRGEYPVFIKSEDFPEKVTTSKHAEYIVAEAAMKVVGADAFRGLMVCEFSGRRGEKPSLWKLFFWNEVARADAITKGIVISGTKIDVYNQNPLKRINMSGDDIEETKVTFSNIPPSFDHEEIASELKKRGYNVTSKGKKDFIRKPDGKLSAKEAGRIIIWIEVPTDPLPKVMKIGPITAKIYHKEQKFCDNCLQYGHLKRNCRNKVACHYCKEVGHKMEDCIKYSELMEAQEQDKRLEAMHQERKEKQRKLEEEKEKQRLMEERENFLQNFLQEKERKDEEMKQAEAEKKEEENQRKIDAEKEKREKEILNKEEEARKEKIEEKWRQKDEEKKKENQN